MYNVYLQNKRYYEFLKGGGLLFNSSNVEELCSVMKKDMTHFTVEDIMDIKNLNIGSKKYTLRKIGGGSYGNVYNISATGVFLDKGTDTLIKIFKPNSNATPNYVVNNYNKYLKMLSLKIDTINPCGYCTIDEMQSNQIINMYGTVNFVRLYGFFMKNEGKPFDVVLPKIQKRKELVSRCLYGSGIFIFYVHIVYKKYFYCN